MAETAEAAPQRWRRLLPWAIALAVLGYLLATVPIEQLAQSMAQVKWLRLALVVVGYVTALLAADSFALWVAFREALPTGVRLRYREMVAVRGASYPLALLNFGAGQGGIVYFLRSRHGVPVMAGTAAVMLATGSFVLVVTAAVGAALLGGAIPRSAELRTLAVVIVAALPLYLLLIAARPAFLAKRAFLQPLFDAGVGGTARVGGARALHLAVLIFSHWAALSLFGVQVPLLAAVAQLPVVFLVAAVPVSPAGLGTSQAAAVALFARYASGDEVTRAAQVLAYSLSFQVTSALLMMAIGLALLRSVAREPATGAPQLPR